MADAALASIRRLKKSRVERRQIQQRVARVRRPLDGAGIPHLDNPSHIVPVMVRDPVRCKEASDRLIDRFGIYVQPINYPTVPRGAERLRITPSPLHSDADIDHLVRALSVVWSELDLAWAGLPPPIAADCRRPPGRSTAGRTRQCGRFGRALLRANYCALTAPLLPARPTTGLPAARRYERVPPSSLSEPQDRDVF